MSAAPWLGGQRVTAERLAEMLPKYSNWTPSWSTSTGAALPSYGNATIDCRYAIVGDLVVANMYISFGTTTNFGGGGSGDDWTFTLPVPAAAATVMIGNGWIGPLVDKRCTIAPRLLATDRMQIEVTAGFADGTTVANSGFIDATTPFAWTSNRNFACNLQYEKA